MKNTGRIVRRPFDHIIAFEMQAKPPGAKTVTENPHNGKPPGPKTVTENPRNRKAPRVERTVNLATAKSTVRLRFEDIQKPRPPSKMNHVVASLSNTPVLQAHRQVAQSEKENVGVEAGHKSEETAEAGLRTTRNIQRSRKLKPYRQAVRIERKLDEANLRYMRQKTTQSQPSLSTNPLSRWQQKQAIRKEYMAIKAGRGIGSATAAAANTRSTAETGRYATETARVLSRYAADSSEKVLAFLLKNKKGFLIVLGVLFVVMMLLNALSSCSQIAFGSLNAVLSTSFTADDKEIQDADLELTHLEAELEYDVLRTENSHPGYDEYRYAIDPIGHDPFELIAYLTARFEDFTYNGVKSEIQSLFSEMYVLTYRPVTEVRYRTETRPYIEISTNPDTGVITVTTGTREVQIPYNYDILNISLTGRSLYSVVQTRMNDEQREMFLVYMDTRGNRAQFGNPFTFDWQPCVASLFGWREHPITKTLQNHRGLDLAVPLGTPILSIHDGRVVTVGYDGSGYGNFLVIEDAEGYRSTYAHCGTIEVHEGDAVSRGDAVATAGSTGTSTGSHLHLELSLNGEYLNPYFYLDGASPYIPGSVSGTGEYADYEVSADALSDPVFAALILEAEKYLGCPYVWGGSTPATSFDCSGFVCWVFQASGVYPLSRTTAQGIYNQCGYVSPVNVRPGDLVFFTGTYDSDGPVSHVGIYVGDGMMINAGKPIQYASINTAYWQRHFYAYGRLPPRR